MQEKCLCNGVVYLEQPLVMFTRCISLGAKVALFTNGRLVGRQFKLSNENIQVASP